jgi:hypothetical protein
VAPHFLFPSGHDNSEYAHNVLVHLGRQRLRKIPITHFNFELNYVMRYYRIGMEGRGAKTCFASYSSCMLPKLLPQVAKLFLMWYENKFLLLFM